MSNSKVKYYKQEYKEYYDNECNTPSKCGLRGVDVDDNFHIINGEHIKSINIEEGGIIQFNRNNGEKIGCQLNLKKEYDEEKKTCSISLVGKLYYGVEYLTDEYLNESYLNKVIEVTIGDETYPQGYYKIVLDSEIYVGENVGNDDNELPGDITLSEINVHDIIINGGTY